MSVKHLVMTLIFFLSVTPLGKALPPFRKPLDQRYAESDRELRAELRRVNCNLCHIKDKKREFVNAYGKILAELIPGNAEDRLAVAAAIGKPARDAEYENVMRELSEAVKKADVRRDVGDLTYGELFRAHKLPAGGESHALRK